MLWFNRRYYLRLFNHFNNTRFFIIFTTIVSIIHYSLLSSKVISNIIWGWWLLIRFSFFPCIASWLFTLCILPFWFLYGCKKWSKTLSSLALYTTLHSIVHIFPIREDLGRFRAWKLIICMGSPTQPWREVIYDVFNMFINDKIYL